jgi:hypothetical protein
MKSDVEPVGPSKELQDFKAYPGRDGLRLPKHRLCFPKVGKYSCPHLRWTNQADMFH